MGNDREGTARQCSEDSGLTQGPATTVGLPDFPQKVMPSPQVVLGNILFPLTILCLGYSWRLVRTLLGMEKACLGWSLRDEGYGAPGGGQA